MYAEGVFETPSMPGVESSSLPKTATVPVEVLLGRTGVELVKAIINRVHMGIA